MRQFTGWHMTSILVAFFGIVIAVNVTMARFALSTFGGTVVDNSYVASQQYNEWLAQGEAQRKLGWTIDVSVDARRRVHVVAREHDGPLGNVVIRTKATHPLGRKAEQDVTLTPQGEGVYLSRQSLPAGRWHIWLEAKRGSDILRQVTEVQ